MEEMPLSFKMELAHNVKAMNAFLHLDDDSQEQIIKRAGSIQTRREMNEFVASLGTPEWKIREIL